MNTSISQSSSNLGQKVRNLPNFQSLSNNRRTMIMKLTFVLIIDNPSLLPGPNRKHILADLNGTIYTVDSVLFYR